MSTENPTAETWPPLPPFPDWPYVVTASDLDFWNDLIKMRQVVDALDADCDVLNTTIRTIPPEWSKELDHEIAATQCLWPYDVAESLIRLWKLSTGVVK